MGSEWRQQLCQLGEDTFIKVLSMWESRSDESQTILLKYLNLQILMHHPQQGKVLLSKKY